MTARRDLQGILILPHHCPQFLQLLLETAAEDRPAAPRLRIEVFIIEMKARCVAFTLPLIACAFPAMSGPSVSSQRSHSRSHALSMPAMGARPPLVSPSIVA